MLRAEDSLVVNFRGHFEFRGHVCLVFDLLYCTLHQLIRHSNQPLSLDFARKIGRQLLVCLAQLGQKAVIHCDLKP
jgi:serine/threonine protein kinase